MITLSSCNENCSSCGVDCPSRKAPQSFLENLAEGCRVGKVIGIVSGKGGVGKSLVTSLLATAFSGTSHAAILDADITGPSIPKMFGIEERATGTDKGLIPVKSRGGVDMMSINLLLEDPGSPGIWRGPVLAGVVKQFWGEVLWNDVDYMFVDMPPGTGDVPLTVFQSLPVDGLIIVTSPQDLVSMIVSKAVNMANMMNIPILGLVENMSYIQCPDCGKKLYPFGKSHVEETAAEFSLPVLAKLPMDPAIAGACDAGQVETLDTSCLDAAVKAIMLSTRADSKAK